MELSVTLCPPDKRKRDMDNFAGKALLDALTLAGVWADDSPDPQTDHDVGGRCGQGRHDCRLSI